MKFLDRVKKVLLEKKEEELAEVEEKIEELNGRYLIERESVESLKQESDECSKAKSKVQRNIINKKEIEDLEKIYNFVENYPRIERILAQIKNAYIPQNYNYIADFKYDMNELIDEEQLRARYQLYRVVKELNEQIIEINNADIEELIKTGQEEKKKQKKRSIFARIFGRKIRDEESSIVEKKYNSKVKEDIFKKYRRTISEFKEYYNGFLVLKIEAEDIIDKASCTRIVSSINSLYQMKKRGIELDKDAKEYSEAMKPFELWQEIYKYYVNTALMSGIIQNFENNIDRYEQLYREKPELFDLTNLERIFKENNQLIIELKSKNKQASDKNSEVMKQKQNEREIKMQLQILEKKKKELREKAGKIENAGTIQELGYKNKEDAAKKLSIETRDYIVIPIQDDIDNIIDLFNEEKTVKVEVGGQTFYTVYSNNIATGRINTIENLENINGVLMIPISLLKKENLDSVKSGKISLNSSVLKLEKNLMILPEGRDIAFNSSKIEIKRYSCGDVKSQVEELLAEDYVAEADEIVNYDIFKNIQNTSNKEKQNRREAVRKCIFENLRRDVTHTDRILVNGKTYFLNQEDEKMLQETPKNIPLNESRLKHIADEIEKYLIEGREKGTTIDQLYRKLLLEYMKSNRKAKADYYEESNTNIQIRGTKINIKPHLPAKDEVIIKRYTRPGEDITYKTMKLANLVNKCAHFTGNEELQEKLYGVKLDLIERVIDLTNNDSNIKVKRKFDEEKKVMSVILEIPGYNMIALHIMNKGESLSRKSNQLEQLQDEILQTSPILVPGVNKELLLLMKNMSIEERIQTLLDFDSNTFYKLVIRMGYNTENIKTEADKKNFIKNMVSDQKISELLKENDELEK